MTKKGGKKVRLTVPLNVLVSPKLKTEVDRAAAAAGLTNNEWVAQVLADKLEQPALAAIPRKSLGRPRVLDAARAS